MKRSVLVSLILLLHFKFDKTIELMTTITMHKRELQNSAESVIDNNQIKKARIEALCSITDRISSKNNSNEKCLSDHELHRKYCQEVNMELENNENILQKSEQCIQHSVVHQAFKYNSICDRDRRRHMYF
jgi:hypothetical protein